MDSEPNLAFCVAWNCTQSSQKLFTIFPPDGVHMWPFWRNHTKSTPLDSIYRCKGLAVCFGRIKQFERMRFTKRGTAMPSCLMGRYGQIWADMGRWPLCGISLKMFGLIGIYTAGGAVAAEMFQFQHRQHRSRCQSRCFSSVQITHWALRLPALRADPTVHNARGRWSTCDAVFHCMTKTTINDDKRGYMTIYQVAV